MSDANKVTSSDSAGAQTQAADAAISNIDKALAAAKARKDAKAGSTTAKAPKLPKEPKAPTEPKRPRLSDEDKAARVAQRDTERAARKTARDEARATKLAERAANKSPAHLRKVNKAGERLGTLSEAAQLLFSDATSNLPAAQVTTLAAHLAHFNRVKATERALTTKVAAGDQVTIVAGDPKFIGKTGVVFKSQRIRAYVTVEGQAKPVYVFTSDLTPIATESVAANG
jgi:hypothetical protein